MMTALAILAAAAALGCASSLLPGPCNLAIVDGAIQRVSSRRLRSTALGGACGDLVYATLGAAGLATLVSSHRAVLYACSGALLIAVGIHRLAVAPTPSRAFAGTGFVAGARLVLSNPAVLLTWGVVVTALAGESSSLVRAAVVLAIAGGSFAGFVCASALPVVRFHAVRTGISGALVVLGVTSLARAGLG
jgi:threonine/homoserine/homoserine lactone efflux protein